ncbi:uncharacterized protein J8A68_004029 [[Candida] subhashii]|uniref:AB hydrolase-1 domain-containing protein n=1 Tax=[Candida] subhashii TaxID=561895 RepID=A0A8J5QL73_9ASCO|nr:uncharacterized protein J8A68_004029 [[Candida] subhashii]KAG7662498.1 hypothetical protein J8A68_004029 [[Candida] subhashii]
MSTYQSTGNSEPEPEQHPPIANSQTNTPKKNTNRQPAPPVSQINDSSSTSEEQLEQQPLLDPDDPQVSPLNLPHIQRLKLFIRILVYINLFLLLILVISEFFSIPWFNNRGKSFLEIDLILICLLINSIHNLFFIIPAYYERIMGIVIAIFLVVDLVVVMAVPAMRQRLGGLGAVLIGWTCFNSFINSMVDYWVQEARNSQEIRFTGRIEKRRTVGELMIMSLKVLIEIFILWIIWCISLTILLSSFDTHEKPWGDLVPVNNNRFRIHLACFGDVYDSNATQPIVLVDGGQLSSSEVFQEWIEELYHLNKLERYCVYDRPGYGFSDSAPPPSSIGIINDYLMEALESQGIEGPFSMVGFDIGGLYVRNFASRYKHKIHSILFVDSWHTDLLKKWPFSGGHRKNEDLSVFKGSLEVMDNLTGFKLWVRGFISPLGLVANIHWFFHPMKYSSKSRIFGSDFIYQSRYIRARCQEQLLSGILSYNEVIKSDINGITVVVVSSDYMIKTSLNWGKWQREISILSDKTSEWIISKDTSHYIWKSNNGKKQLQDVLLRLID